MTTVIPTTIETPTSSPGWLPTSSTGVGPTRTTVIEIEGEGTVVVRQPRGCPSEEGSPTDLDSEPATWLAYGNYLRWTDAEGCLVRVDVISHIRGADHCEYQTAEYLTIGPRLGESITEDDVLRVDANRFIWDPHGVIQGGPYGQIIEGLPPDGFDTGYRQNGDELWLTTGQPVGLYRVGLGMVQEWHPSLTLGICM
ncbi:MAG: hypothetical protein GY926_21165 [bacterium]|nr:hypothetical protein [Actinomycetes bacterium]MCP4967730.1 hypothetical protein [bacterium]